MKNPPYSEVIIIVIFDLDGTLYRTHETCLPAFREMCALYKIPLTKESENFLLYTTTDSFLRKNAPEMTAEQRVKFGKEIKWREISAVKERDRLFDGIRELLDSLVNDGIEMAICGMGSKEYIDTVLEHCDIAKYFKAVYHRVEGLTKTQVMKTLLTDMNLESNQCLMIGDSTIDLTAAQENDVPFIGVSYGYGADDVAQSEVLVNDAAQLQTAIYRSLLYLIIERDISLLQKQIQKPEQQPIVVGINGVDTSGKTVFALGLENYLRHRGIHTQIIHLDDFHNPRTIRYADISPEGYIKHAFDLPKLSNLLRQLRQCPSKITVDLLDLDADTYTNEKTFQANDNSVIIVEGVLLYREPIDMFFDYRIFLDITFDEVLHRAQARDVPKYGKAFLQRYIDRYIPAQKIYLNEYFPKEKCRLIIDNNDFTKPKIQAIQAAVLSDAVIYTTIISNANSRQTIKDMIY